MKTKSDDQKRSQLALRSSAAEYLTFIASTGEEADNVEMRYEDENIWLSQKMMAELYDVKTPTINYHVRKVFSDLEIQEEAVVRNFLITAEDGKGYSVKHYGLEMIIAVGFKVNSERAVQFRKWVNQIARPYFESNRDDLPHYYYKIARHCFYAGAFFAFLWDKQSTAYLDDDFHLKLLRAGLPATAGPLMPMGREDVSKYCLRLYIHYMDEVGRFAARPDYPVFVANGMHAFYMLGTMVQLKAMRIG